MWRAAALCLPLGERAFVREERRASGVFLRAAAGTAHCGAFFEACGALFARYGALFVGYGALFVGCGAHFEACGALF